MKTRVKNLWGFFEEGLKVDVSGADVYGENKTATVLPVPLLFYPFIYRGGLDPHAYTNSEGHGRA